jgi:hypothetical protein
MCESGKNEMQASEELKENSVAARFWLAAMLPWVSITPLGSPVVPEV